MVVEVGDGGTEGNLHPVLLYPVYEAVVGVDALVVALQAIEALVTGDLFRRQELVGLGFM
jgi:hypothetical protein